MAQSNDELNFSQGRVFNLITMFYMRGEFSLSPPIRNSLIVPIIFSEGRGHPIRCQTNGQTLNISKTYGPVYNELN